VLENAVESHLRKGAIARGGWCAKMIDEGRRGAPDRELRMPNAKLIFVETKRPRGGKLKSWQVEYHRDLRALGYDVETLYSVGEVDSFWRRYDLWLKNFIS